MALTTEEFAERVFASALGSIDIYAIHIGDRLGLYRHLAGRDLTSTELARAAGTDERYTREWLEQQATSGILEVDTSRTPLRFTLPVTHQKVLAEFGDSSYLAPLARMLSTAGEKMSDLLEAYRVGGGVGWDSFGPGMRESQADMNRPFFEHALARVMGGLDRVHDLLAAPYARAADVGCGAGWSSIALARAYPNLTIDGFDIDAPAIDMARDNAAAAAVADRVTFRVPDIADNPPDARYDVVFAFECIHDMPQPVAVLAAMRRMVTPDGAVIVMDEAVADEFTGAPSDVDRLMYGFSLLVCLPDGRSTQPSAATGTVMRPSVLQRYARDAGFSAVRTVAEEGFFRFYELVQ